MKEFPSVLGRPAPTLAISGLIGAGAVGHPRWRAAQLWCAVWKLATVNMMRRSTSRRCAVDCRSLGLAQARGELLCMLQTRVSSNEFIRRLWSATMSAELRRGVVAGMLLYGGGVVVRTLSEIVFARLMGPGDFGVYSYIFAWLTILAVAGGFGVPYAFVRFIPEYEVFKNYGGQRRLARFARLTALAFGVAVGALGVAVILTLGPAGADRVAIVLGMAAVPALALLTVQSELARGFRRVVLAYLPPLVLRPLLTLAFGLAILSGTGHLTAAQGLAAGLVAILACLVVQRARVHDLLTAHPRGDVADRLTGNVVDPDRAERSGWLRVAIPLLVINLLAAIAMRADVIVVGIDRGSRAAGVYAVAARVALLSTFALEALNTIVAPTISKLYYAREYNAVQQLVRNAARVTFGASLGVTLLLELAGPRSLEVFGSGYTGGMTALQVLLIGQLINASTGPVTYLMISTGEQNLAAIAQAVATGLFLVSALVLTSYWGIVGTAVAVTLGRAMINVWMVVAAQQRLKIRSFIV
jgi:O-antigen/teichoic acid export membrane protein